MAKFKNPSPLSKQERETLLEEFALALSEVSGPEQALALIKDLLSEQEAEMLAKRIKIAELLIDGYEYGEIQEALHTSPITISRVGEWLKMSGDGYRFIVERVKAKRRDKKSPKETPSEWSKLKRRYPMMFWPQLLVDDIIASANKRQKQRIRDTLEEMGEKKEMYDDLHKALKKYGY